MLRAMLGLSVVRESFACELCVWMEHVALTWRGVSNEDRAALDDETPQRL